MSTINLLPEDYLERRAQQRANILCLILFGVVMAGVVGAAVVSEEQARQVRQVREQVSQQYRQASQLITQMQQLEAKKKKVIDKAQMAAKLLERVPRSYLLACLTNALPAGGSLTHVELKTTQPKARPAAGKEKTKFASRTARRKVKEAETPALAMPVKVSLEITGLAETDEQVAEFITNMHSNPLMRSVELVYSKGDTVDDVATRKFQVTMELKPGARVEVRDAEAEKELAAVTLGRSQS